MHRIILALILASIMVHADALAAAGVLKVFYSANRRGNLEPCGCHVTAQGGVAHEAPIYGEQTKGAACIRIDAGEWMAPQTLNNPVAALQSRYMLLALEALQYDAINMSVVDARVLPGYMEFFAKQHPKAAELVVSANIFQHDRTDQHAFKPYRILEKQLEDGKKWRIGITGITDFNSQAPGIEQVDPQTHGGVVALTPAYAIKDPAASLKAVMAELKPKTDLVIVLHAGDQKGATALLESVKDVSYLITTATPADRVSVLYSVTGANLLYVPSPSGRQIGTMTLRARTPGWEFESRPEMIDVKLREKPDPRFAQMTAEFNKISGKDLPMSNRTAERRYAGAHRCVVCHNKIYRSWKATPHARAMDKVMVQGDQFTTDSLRRATTGYGQPGGFKHPRDIQSQFLMNVQCESCHGPALTHAEIQTKIKSSTLPTEEKTKLAPESKKLKPVKTVPQATCTTCHDPSTDPTFTFARDYEKVKH